MVRCIGQTYTADRGCESPVPYKQEALEAKHVASLVGAPALLSYMKKPVTLREKTVMLKPINRSLPFVR